MSDIEAMFTAFDVIDNEVGELDPLPGSDFADDEAAHSLVPGLAFDLFATAIDHLRSLRLQSGQPPAGQGAWSARAPWTLLRGALESVSQAIWLICENERLVRIERHLRLWNDDHLQLLMANKHSYRIKDQKAYYEDALVRWKAEFDPQIDEFFSDDPKAVARIREKVNLIDCINEAAEFVGVAEPYRVNVLWRVAGGYAHGRPWAWNFTGRTVEAEHDGRAVQRSSLDFKTIDHLIAVVVVSIQYCHWLMKERCGVQSVYEPLLILKPSRPNKISARNRTQSEL